MNDIKIFQFILIDIPKPKKSVRSAYVAVEKNGTIYHLFDASKIVKLSFKKTKKKITKFEIQFIELLFFFYCW